MVRWGPRMDSRDLLCGNHPGETALSWSLAPAGWRQDLNSSAHHDDRSLQMAPASPCGVHGNAEDLGDVAGRGCSCTHPHIVCPCCVCVGLCVWECTCVHRGAWCVEVCESGLVHSRSGWEGCFMENGIQRYNYLGASEIPVRERFFGKSVLCKTGADVSKAA